MIIAYTGTPGAGKTLDIMRQILFMLRTGRRVLCNINVELPPQFRKYKHRMFNMKNDDITPEYLVRFAVTHHDLEKTGRELQTVVIIDECQLKFSDTFMTKKQAQPWLWFFSQHRKLRFDFMMVTQSIRTGLVRDIRDKVEIEYTHWKMSNYPTKSIVLGLIFLLISVSPIEIFMSVGQWKAMPDRNRLIRRLYMFKPRYAKMYDTYEIIDMAEFERLLKLTEPERGILPEHAQLLEPPDGLTWQLRGVDAACGGDPRSADASVL